MLLLFSASHAVSFNNLASAQFSFSKPGWGIGLDPTVSPSVPRPAASLNIAVFEYDLNGKRCAFARQNDSIWMEFQGPHRYRFAEVARNADYIELLDTGRNIRVRLYRNQSVINVQGRGWQHLYWGGAR